MAAAGMTVPVADLSKRKYVHYDPSLSKVGPNEEQNIQTVKETFERVIKRDTKQNGHAYPTTHAKTLGIVKGKLIVSNNLPPHLKQGLFSKAGEHDVVMRYSFNNHDAKNDMTKSFSRAVTMKVFNVPGERFPEGKDNTTHDFFMNSQLPMSELNTPQVAQEVISLLEQQLTDPAAAGAAFMKRTDKPLQMASNLQPKRRVESMEFYGQIPYRFGDYVAKFGIFPTTEEQLKRSVLIQPGESTNEAVVNWIKEFYASNEAVYDFKFQLLENLQEQPVEDSGIAWPVEKYPYQTVAKLVFPKQNSVNEKLFNFWETNMKLSIWRGPKTHEPLGGSARVRRQVYPYSQKIRDELNNAKRVDVQKIQDLPS